MIAASLSSDDAQEGYAVELGPSKTVDSLSFSSIFVWMKGGIKAAAAIKAPPKMNNKIEQE